MRVTQIKLMDRMFLVGPPGIGKTEIVRDLAEEEAKRRGKVFIDLCGEVGDDLVERVRRNPSGYYLFLRVVAPHVSPEEVSFPRYRGGFVDVAPPRKLYLLTLPGVEGVLFVDEITNVQLEAQVAMFFSLVQEKEFGWGFKLSPSVKVILAGNPPDWSEVVRSLPKPLRSRLTILEVDAPSIEEWRSYMERKYGERWEKRAYLYLKMYPHDFIRPPADDWGNFPTPRNWTALAALLYELESERAPSELVEEACSGRLGKEVGAKFYAFLSSRISPEEVELVAENPELFASLNLSKKLLIIYALSSAPLGDLLKKYNDLLYFILRRERELLALFLRLLPPDVRAEYAAERMDWVEEAVGSLEGLELG